MRKNHSTDESINSTFQSALKTSLPLNLVTGTKAHKSKLKGIQNAHNQAINFLTGKNNINPKISKLAKSSRTLLNYSREKTVMNYTKAIQKIKVKDHIYDKKFAGVSLDSDAIYTT